MLFSYGQGVYIEGDYRVEGEILLGEYKLFLRSPSGDITKTYIPLDKIEKLRMTFNEIVVFVRPSLYISYTVRLKPHPKKRKELVRDIVRERDLKKRFWHQEWVDRGT